jgi:hypothetical protein
MSVSANTAESGVNYRQANPIGTGTCINVVRSGKRRRVAITEIPFIMSAGRILRIEIKTVQCSARFVSKTGITMMVLGE